MKLKTNNVFIKILSFKLCLCLFFYCIKNNQAKKNFDAPTILFFGNSLTEGLGLPSPELCFVSIIEKKLKDYNLNYKVLNLGLSGDTTTSALQRFEKVLKIPIDIFVLELGANDYLNGIPAFIVEENLNYMIREVKNKNPNVKILLTGLEDFTYLPKHQKLQMREYEKVYKKLQKKYDILLFPFILKDVAGKPHLNQKDGLHPNAKGHKIIAENIWPYIKQLINH